ncbi:sensor histidine kinase [Aquibacillus kalidii]|uniref:sensor histidine kinase n=1 Tax=Aquibacillus kalidii TaxID=2762597 RepID=UPI001644D328|nr:sensor histidine kinase [Aquibacillus kalidii]
MSSVITRSITFSIIISFLFSITLLAIVFLAFPFDYWSELWERTVLELPFILVVPILNILIGVLVGLIIAVTWSKRISLLEEAVESVQQANTTPITEKLSSFEELSPITEKLHQVQTYILDQKKRTQKLINERVEDQEQQIEKVISEERNRLARELHDSVSQELFAASMMVSAVNEAYADTDQLFNRQLRQIEAMIQQAQLEMRALLLHLRPIALKDKSLKDGMEQLLEELKMKVPIEVTWEMENVKMSKGVEDHLFRILQESVSNTLRHSKAHALDVLLIERDHFVILRVVDDGVGFQVDEDQASSYGLMNMRERAAEIGADFRMISIPNKGTRLEVRVPIIETEGDENRD